jgi:TRAP-type mannitol/chloroaromatic compound transport system substrate-binding protein
MNDLLNGHIQKRRVRCGKSNCKCARGFSHTTYYHVWHEGGRRFQRYVRLSEVDNLRHKCEQNRKLQTKLRAGRAEYKQLLARARELFRRLS